MIRTIAFIAVLAASLSGCAAAPTKPARPGAPLAASARSSTAVAPQVMAAQGLSGVIGSGASALTQRFGQPRLDVAEGDVRKLQFAGATCVLDIYLYLVAAATEPTATHVESRLREGGAASDPGTCIREVERR
jgi:tetrahydromethanopterin S-methyltransferase subunit D